MNVLTACAVASCAGAAIVAAWWIRTWRPTPMKFAVVMLGLAGFVTSGSPVLAQALSADDVKWIKHHGQPRRRSQCHYPQKLLLHERKNGQQRNPLHHRVGKDQPGGARRLRPRVRLEVGPLPGVMRSTHRALCGRDASAQVVLHCHRPSIAPAGSVTMVKKPLSGTSVRSLSRLAPSDCALRAAASRSSTIT